MAESGPEEAYNGPVATRLEYGWEHLFGIWDVIAQTPDSSWPDRFDPTGWKNFASMEVEQQQASLERSRKGLLRLGATFGFVTYAVLLYAVTGDQSHPDWQGQYVFEIALHLLKMLQGQVGTAYLHVTGQPFLTGWFAVRPIQTGGGDDWRPNMLVQRHNLAVIMSVVDYAELYYSVCLNEEGDASA
jgi:hypothetical protein